MAIGTVVLVLVLLAGCSSLSHPDIYGARASGDGTTFELEMASCNGDYGVVVAESTEQVRVDITDQRRRSPFYGDDCSDAVGPIQLAEPLGDRRLMDGFHNVEIAVRYYPWNQVKYSDAEYLNAVEAAAQCVEELDPDAVVTITTHPDGYPDLHVDTPDLGDGERRIGEPAFVTCNERHVVPLSR
jgi:hypothetical protein